MKKSILFITLAVLIITLSATFINTSTLSKYGSRGDEVREIQSRLQKWGYDIKKVDGIFGSNTKKAVIKFQGNNGLKQDGIAGEKTLEKMGISSNSASGSAETNARLLARIINAEARGESYTGQVAVGAVVLNRVEHSSFPNTIAGVIYQPGAFTALQDGQWNAQMYDTPYKAAKDALNGWDPTGGAIYYYNPAKTTNNWIYSRPVITTIGKHVFAK
ncbi:MAG: spore cortex-lytic enzyme [Clostridia bacterium]|nr:spore cortex-lytic enzyme [Clostridia bacterium]